MALGTTISRRRVSWRFVASLLIKTAVLAGTFGFIYHKVFHNQNIAQIKSQFEGLINNWQDLMLLSAVIGLMLLNWGLEAHKWKFLLRKIESLSFMKSLKSIFAGACVSIFTPNRLGEFGGRIFYLSRSNRLSGVFITLLGNMGQLAIALTAGLLGTLLFINYFHPFMLNTNGWLIASTISLLGIVTLFSLLFNLNKVGAFFKIIPTWIGIKLKERFSSKWMGCANLFKLYSLKDLFWLIFLSALRFTVYCIQFYLLLYVLGISLPVLQGMVLIIMCFFTLTIVPTITLSELGIRGSVAIYFIGHLSQDSMGILAASFSLWVINLVIPAIIGSYFVYRIKLFSSSNPQDSSCGQFAPVHLG